MKIVSVQTFARVLDLGFSLVKDKYIIEFTTKFHNFSLGRNIGTILARLNTKEILEIFLMQI